MAEWLKAAVLKTAVLERVPGVRISLFPRRAVTLFVLRHIFSCMPRKQKKRYHYLYKTTCLINNRFYYGIHSTYNLKDGYLGSGAALRKSIWKYGKENHVKEILEFFKNREDLCKRESQIVNEDLLKNENCMNLILGGGNILPISGSITYNKMYSSDIQRSRQARGVEKMNWLRENDKRWKEEYSKKLSESQRKAVEAGTAHCLTGDSFRGKSHTQETKSLMSESHKKNGDQQGAKNSQYGTCWIYNPGAGINKKIKKDELTIYIELGWMKGRKMNPSSKEKLY